MLLAIDVGNSQTVVGLFDGSKLEANWRLTSFPAQTSDELGVLLHVLMSSVGRDKQDVRGVAVSSVVPSLTSEYRRLGDTVFGQETLVVDHSVVPELKILYHDPSAVGADRLVNAVAAVEKHGAPAVVVDLGTATTFDVINAAGEYAGGVIMPGVATSAQALFQRGARLSKVEIRRPAQVVGRTTEESLQAGIFFGAVGGVDHMVRRIREEMGFGPDLPVIATGGLAAALAADSETITVVDENLTLTGIRLVWQRHRGK